MCLSFGRLLTLERTKYYWISAASLFLIIHSPVSSAKHWDITPGIQVGEIYTDNITLAPAGKAQSEFITEVTPGLTVKGKAPRASLDLDYHMQNFFYAKNSGRNNTYHRLRANGNAKLINNFLYFDASSYMSQQIISPNGQIPYGNFSQISNRTDVRTYRASPYIRYAFGTTASTQIRYTFAHINYGKRPLYNNDSNRYSVVIKSGPSFHKLNWRLSAYRDEIAYNNGRNISFESAIGELGWLLTRTLRAQGTFGYDKNQYLAINGRNSGKRWSIGLKWAPSARTSVSGSYGRRYYGNNYEFKLRHRSRLTTWTASYSIIPSTTRNLQLSQQVVALINPSGQAALVNLTVPVITSQVYIMKRAQLSAVKKLKSGNIDLSVYHVRRSYQETGQTSVYYGTHDSLSWSLGRRSRIELTGAWLRYSENNGTGRSSYWYAGGEFSRRLGRNLSASLKYRHVVRGGTSQHYSENIIYALFNATF